MSMANLSRMSKCHPKANYQIILLLS
jgi:hypothetical protein